MSRKHHLLRKYGLTEEQYENLLDQQGKACGICKRLASEFKYKLCVDHDHHTGAIRGILCHHCNRRVLGRLRHPDGTKLLQAAAEYLSLPSTGHTAPSKVKKRRKKRGKRISKHLKLRRTRRHELPDVHQPDRASL